MLPDICKRLDILVFSDKNEKLQAASPAFSRYQDVKEPTHLLQRVGNGVPGVVVCPGRTFTNLTESEHISFVERECS